MPGNAIYTVVKGCRGCASYRKGTARYDISTLIS